MALPGSDSPLELYHLLRHARRFLHERFEKHGRVFRSRFVYRVVFAVGENANKTLLVTKRQQVSFGQGYAATAVQRIFAGSIMLQDGEEHRAARELLTPAVGTLAVKESAEAVRRVWSRVAESVRSPMDAYALAQRTTFEVAANVLTGLELGAETDAFRPLFERLIDGIMSPVRVRIPLGRLDRALTARAEIERMLRPRILAAREKPPVGLLGQLAHSDLPPDEVSRHLLLLFWAGYDTTASAASWILHELARRGDWQEKLRKGQDVDAFLCEIERMYPSALFFPRVALEDVEIEGCTIPKGTTIFYCPYLSHRDPASFEGPNVFDPERWTAARGDKRASPAKLVGFGGGPRVCLGKAFAKLQLKVMVEEILSRWRIEPDPTCMDDVMMLPVHHPRGSRLNFSRLS
jgi:cytochrome P450